jgi:hypothetical protein
VRSPAQRKLIIYARISAKHSKVMSADMILPSISDGLAIGSVRTAERRVVESTAVPAVLVCCCAAEIATVEFLNGQDRSCAHRDEKASHPTPDSP